MIRALAALAAYLAIAAVYTHPLLAEAGRRIANDRFDPVLNASILWWNATTLPFSARWWRPPHFHPVEGGAAFTENLAGLWPVSTPLYWLSGDPLVTYNLTFFLTWPLCGWAVYLLVRRLTSLESAAFVGGLAFAFAPYRVAQLAHVQVLACFWLPVAFAALHAYRDDRRGRWLAVFGAAWVLQSLTNGYFMMFAAVLITAWLVYFCSPASHRRAGAVILASWFGSSLLLLPVLLVYRQVHSGYGLRRSPDEIAAFAARPGAWLSVSDLIPVWTPLLRDRGSEWNLFPGLTVILLVAAACAYRLWHRTPDGDQSSRTVRVAVFALGGVAAAACLVTVVTLLAGPWRLDVLGVRARASGVERPVVIALAAGLLWLAANRRTRAAIARRSPLAFYIFGTVLMMVVSLGPEIRADERVMLQWTPYDVLMALPGFSGLRVPPRAWMLGAFCLATAGGLGFARLAPRRRAAAALLVVVTGAGILADARVREMPMATAPERWPLIESPGRTHPVLELPLGRDGDPAATYRAVGHGRRVVNGLSGYEPPHYDVLRRALARRDATALLALTALGPLDVVVDRSADTGGALADWISSVPGSSRVADDGTRVVFELPAATELERGPVLAIARVGDSSGARDFSAVTDADVLTGWADNPRQPVDAIVVELAAPAAVGSVVQSINAGAAGTFPPRLSVDVSDDGVSWREAWQGSTAGAVILALIRRPVAPEIEIPLAHAGERTRFVRLRAIVERSVWQFTELRVHGPSR